VERLEVMLLAECADSSAEPHAVLRGFAEVDAGIDS
jgi:hypothetical protein